MRYHNLLFDLDGTLVDPKIGITQSIQYALAKLDLSIPAMKELEWCIGPPLQHSFAKLVDPSLIERALEYYREQYVKIGCFEHRVYPGIFEMLSIFCKSKIRLFIATSKPTLFAEKIADHFGLSPFFEKIYGSEMNGVRSDKADLLRYIQEKSALRGPSLMVGDRGIDMAAAVENQIEPLGVAYGYGSQKELLDAGAVHICNFPMEIIQWLGS
ncbi:MAG: HAD family hydrolase [Chlamydiae bacterium]|nr:HAD family hydrolase [Chlamydiota bacterium]